MFHAHFKTTMRGAPLPQRMPELSVVIAVGNHEDSIGHEIRSVAAHLGRLGRAFEILAVNNGSSDNSFSIVNILAGSIPELRVLGRESSGRPFLRGSSEARGDVVVLLDAGKRVSLAPLGWALSRLGAGRDAVVLRGRYVVARRLAALPVIVRASGPGPVVRGGVRAARARAGNRRRGIAPAPPDAAPAPPGASLPGRVTGRWRPGLRAGPAGPVLVLRVMLSILVAIVGLGLLIVLHEGGHFLVARLCGMRVERFSIGFGPTLLGFEHKGTTFQIAPIPLGGFVQITGMNPNEEFDKSDPMVYPNRPRWMRMATILAGPAANYLTAFVLTLFVLLAFGMPSKTQKILEPVAGRPAAVAGMKAGDVLVDGERADGRRRSPDHRGHPGVAGQAGRHQGPARRPADRLPGRAPTTSRASTRSGSRSGRSTSGRRSASAAALKEAVVYPYYASVGILEGLYDMVRGQVHADLSGPIGITKQIAKAAIARPGRLPGDA